MAHGLGNWIFVFVIQESIDLEINILELMIN